ncbi:protein of unknown function [Hyphomicrobium sp. 1Nfss2.1]
MPFREMFGHTRTNPGKQSAVLQWGANVKEARYVPHTLAGPVSLRGEPAAVHPARLGTDAVITFSRRISRCRRPR